MNEMKKLFLISALLLVAPNGWGDVKELTCIEPIEHYLLARSKWMTDEEIEECKLQIYGDKVVIVFDTDDLSNDNATAEWTSYVCHSAFEPVGTGTTKSVSVTSTPNIISFSKFNVDRKTLEAGLTTNRDLKCTIKDLDMSENVF